MDASGSTATPMKLLKPLIFLMVLLGAAVLGWWVLAVGTNRPDTTGLRDYRHGAMRRLEFLAAPPPAPEDMFLDPAGKAITLSAFRGKPVLVNLWATWCPPCVKEMPTLAALQRAIGTDTLRVLPVSLDKDADREAAREFLGKFPEFEFFQDSDFGLALGARAQGFPTTILYDSNGREVARLSGEADWASPEAIAFLRAAIAAKG